MDSGRRDIVMEPLGKQERASAGRPHADSEGLARPRRLSHAASHTLPRHLAADALRRRMLACADAAALLLALAILAEKGTLSVAAAFWTASLVPLWIVLAKLHGLYDRDHRALRHLTVDELGSIVTWATVATAVSMPILALTPPGALSSGAAVQLWLAVAVSAPLLRGAARLLWRLWTPAASILLIGSGPLERATRRKLELFGDIHMRVAGELDVDRLGSPHGGVPLEQQMRKACEGAFPERVIVCTENVLETVLADIVAICRNRRIKLSVVPPLRAAFGTAVRLSHVAELPFVEYHTGDPSISTQALKRGVDLVVGGFALVLAMPILLLSALAIKLDSRGPVFYVQRRAGLEGTPFRMLKFRTMVDGAHARLGEIVQIESLADPMFKVRDDPRVTRVGRILRRWSLDELPQLVNVLRGEMSLVGPRPEQLELVERYREEHRFRLQARPGMTGPMQVFGRGDLEFEERLAVEREYIENLSLGRDIRILLMTLPAVVSGKGAF
jgi:exopolysaccharide biosynthesis polyprenyl glycosylphosphotransferase